MTSSSDFSFTPPSFGPDTVQGAAKQDASYSVPTSVQIEDVLQRVIALESKQINLNTDIIGLFETVAAVPTGKPKNIYDQIKIYVNGATLRLYWYDVNADTWHYVTATA